MVCLYCVVSVDQPLCNYVKMPLFYSIVISHTTDTGWPSKMNRTIWIVRIFSSSKLQCIGIALLIQLLCLRWCTRYSLIHYFFELFYSYIPFLWCNGKHRIFSPNEMTWTRMLGQYTLTKKILPVHPDKRTLCWDILTRECFADTLLQENVMAGHPDKRMFCRTSWLEKVLLVYPD